MFPERHASRLIAPPSAVWHLLCAAQARQVRPLTVMTPPFTFPAALRVAAALLMLVVGQPAVASAQYFGRTKVQYTNFRFRVMRTPHFAIYFYPEERVVTADAARMAERWYARHSATFGHTFASKPIIFYADQADFQQTNVVGEQLTEETGGVTEASRDRVILPFTGM